MLGAILALAGVSLPSDLRGALTLVAVASLGVVGLVEARGGRVRMLQRDVETKQRWLHLGAAGWSVSNGLALGFGAGTRIGFPIWYLIPVTAFATAKPIAGLAIGAVYGLLRGGATVPWFWYMNQKVIGSNEVAEILFALKPVGHRIGGAALCLLSVIAVFAVA